jgi:ryanodine receptor 2
VDLSPEIAELLERLAQHNHDVWARQRFADGWRPGPVRNDDRKEHPCLVPYAELPESEKEYDRNTAQEVLKAVLALGYRIEKPNNNGENQSARSGAMQ